MADPDVDGVERRMKSAVDVLKQELTGLRTGRASASLLDPVVVKAYGSDMRINEVATISVPESRLITVQVWDRGNVTAVDKAIRGSNLGLNPAVDGQLIRVPLPELNEERRKELVKIASKYAEQARVAVRNVRRDGMEMLKRMMRDGDLSEDDHDVWSKEVQEMTDQSTKQIDDLFHHKEKEILQV